MARAFICRVVPVRALILVVFAAACHGAQADLASGGDDEHPGEPGADAPAECAVDADCIPASASCCDMCPSYALPASSGWGEVCEDVGCPVDGFDPSCGRATAVCEAGSCTLACTVRPCDLTCDAGFAMSDDGCLVCACADGGAPPTAPQCEVDADCVQVPADCCGCQNGGADRAVPASEADAAVDELGCSDAPVCPGTDVCDSELVPRCVAGSCALATPPEPDGDDDGGAGDPGAMFTLCGASHLPACPDGEVCVINDPEASEASAQGLGICRPE